MSENMETLAIQSLIFMVRSIRRSKVVSQKTDAELAIIESRLDGMISNKVDSILEKLDKIPD